ncbi:hypothetical protein TNCV_452581 [Trichonephila clavipes]|nr:hypothetical protein TNCV_452581 [Trichonephila clavipes]
MHICTPKYCGVLSSDTTPATYDREKTERLDACEPETPSIIRGARKKQPHPKTIECMGSKSYLWRKVEVKRKGCQSSVSSSSFDRVQEVTREARVASEWE